MFKKRTVVSIAKNFKSFRSSANDQLVVIFVQPIKIVRSGYPQVSILYCELFGSQKESRSHMNLAKFVID